MKIDFRQIFKRPGRVLSRDKTRAGAVISPRQGAVDLSAATMHGQSSPSVALTVSTVYRCVQFLSDTVANLPVLHKRDLGGGVFAADATSPFNALLNIEPAPERSAFDFWRLAMQCLLFDGNAYIVPVRDDLTGEIYRLAVCNPRCVSYDPYTDTYDIGDAYNAVSGKYDESRVIHFRGMPSPYDSKRGVSVLTYARYAVDISDVSQSETRDRFANGGSVRGIISNDVSARGFGKYADDQLAAQAQSLDERFRSGERIVSTVGDVNFKQVSMSAADMQFLESRKFTVLEICRFFGVHPSFVFGDTSANYKSAEMANVAFLSNTLAPLLRSIENELTRKLIPRASWARQRFEFDRFGLYACDLDGRVRYQTQTIANGTRSINDWRRIEGLMPVEGGDSVLVSANLRNLGECITESPNDNKQENGE